MDDNEPIRKRIVINLDSPPGKPGVGPRRSSATRRPRRWPKVLAFLVAFIIVLLVLAAGGSYLWWRHYQTTPSYSLALIVDAAQRGQMETFDKQIDDDEIAKNMIGSIGQKAAGRYGVSLNASVQHQIDTLLPTLLPRVKQTVHEEITREIKDLATGSGPRPFIFLALAVPSFVTIKTDGDSARASGKLKDRDFELGLRRDGSLWKVVEVNDNILVERIVDSVMKDFPAIGRDLGALDLLRSPLLSKPKKKR